MTENHNEPVEISTRMRPGEWTPESLDLLVGSYQEKIHGMGAPRGEIETSVQTPDDGSAHVHVSWQRAGTHTFADFGRNNGEELDESDVARGHGESIPRGEATQDAQGLGAVFGDAERSAIDEPPSDVVPGNGENQPANEYLVHTDANGRTTVEDVGPAKE